MSENAAFVLNDGWVSVAQRIESPNCDNRPGALVSMIVVHAISLPPSQFGSRDIERLFTNALDPEAHPYFANIHQLRVSAHFLIRRDGALIQFVSCLQRAWHAGKSCWDGREQCNDFSIGIELEGSDDTPFEDAQYQQLLELIKQLCKSFPVEVVVGHSDISSGRKTDPGPFFDWQLLVELGQKIVPHISQESCQNKIS